MSTYLVGPYREYTTINAALNVAATGDSIVIDEGIYNENIIMENKIVNLIGRTDHPEEGKVVISGNARYGVVQLRWGSVVNIDLVLEGIKFQNLYEGTPYYLMQFIRTGTIWSGLNLTINKCILDCTNFESNKVFYAQYEYYGKPYYSLNSLELTNCDIFMYGNKFVDNDFDKGVPTCKLLNSRLNATPEYTKFPSPYNDYISTSRNFPDYGTKYGNFLLDSLLKDYEFVGNIKENGDPVSRELRVFRQDNDVFIGSTVSSPLDGFYKVKTTYGGNHYIICLDSSGEPYYNDLVKTKCIPIKVDNSIIFDYTYFNIANPSATYGNAAGWLYENGWPKVHYGGHNDSYKFGGKDSAGNHIIVQRLDLIEQGVSASGIDTENCYLNLSCWKQCVDTHYGSVYLGSRLYDENNDLIGPELYTHEVSYKTDWQRYVYERNLISGTRYVDVLCKSSNSEYWVSSYFDDINAYLRFPVTYNERTGKVIYIDLENPGAETGNTDGWVLDYGNLQIVGRFNSTEKMFFVDDINNGSMFYQRVSLVDKNINIGAVDSGMTKFSFNCEVRLLDQDDNDKTYLGIRSVDGTDSVIDTYWKQIQVVGSEGELSLREISTILVSGTRYVDVIVRFDTPGNGCGYVDNFQPWISYLDYYSVLTDDFTGPDGEGPDLSKWEVNKALWSNGTQTANISIQSNKLNIPVSTGNVTSLFKLTGNLDYQVEVDGSNCNSTNYIGIVYFWIDVENRVGVYLKADGTFDINYNISNSWMGSKIIPRNSLTCTLRFVRIDNQMIIKVKDGSADWQIARTFTFLSDDGYAVLHANHGDASSGSTAFDNFKINKGKLIY